MRAAQMTERPDFMLMTQNDIQTLYYMQMPLWLFSDSRYADLSLDAKVTYTFLLNRFQLSRRKGWVNDQGEVFVIFPRKALAAELRVGIKRVTAAFRDLAEKKLIWERRCGLGDANQIYLAVVCPQADPDYECAPFHSQEYEDGHSRSADLTTLAESDSHVEPISPLQNSQNGHSGEPISAIQEGPKQPTSKKEKRNTDLSQKEVSQSFSAFGADGQADAEEEELMDILDACELFAFPSATAKVFENAVERLFYSDSFRIGKAVLPKCRIRSKLKLLDGMILMDAERKLSANLGQEVKNSTAYVMATILNCVAEHESDSMVDPYLNSLRDLPGKEAV